MGPKVVGKSEGKRKKEMLTIEIKKEMIEKYEQGARVSELARQYGRNMSTISTVIKQAEAIKKVNASKGTTILSKRRGVILEEMERLLLIWIKDKEIAGDSVTEAIICQKACAVYNDLKTAPEGNAEVESHLATEEEFKASHGWFEKFKKRTGIHSVVRHGEAASCDAETAKEFVQHFENIVEEGGYVELSRPPPFAMHPKLRTWLAASSLGSPYSLLLQHPLSRSPL
ncbi:tigger transposable element-derived protein 1-like [Corythoichthys intestinalis]|uniref:tigger transposable element-derived protein 1-like n=1 Tax=Corythoichthys intestinalis TaxID=161448 RepID=UPI0025A6355D|nr:tigger transposable element-derived protein 1-like [Corythoichthys intestinalis]